MYDDLDADIESFLQQYPVDDDSHRYLTGSSPEVKMKVLREFKPKREGEADYSSLLITFTKRCRLSVQQSAQAPAPLSSQMSMNAQIDDFRVRYPFDEDAYRYLSTSPPAVQHQVLRTFKPQREGEDDYSAIVMTFTKRCREKVASMPAPAQMFQRPSILSQRAPPPVAYRAPPVPPVAARTHSVATLEQELEYFCDQYPMDDDARNYLFNSSPHVQEQVLRGFKPQREGDGDYSAIIISFTKRCRGASPAVPVMGAGGCGFGGPPAIPRGHPPGMAAPFEVQVEEFRSRFPFDEDAYNYLRNSPPNVWSRVFREFRPTREGDSDYSALIITFTKRCRGAQDAPAAFGGSAPRGPGGCVGFPAPAAGFGSGCGSAMRRPLASGGSWHDAAIADFFRRYPSDARAKEYLSESSEDVVARVLQEFKPRREGDSDYSAAVMAYVSRCRKEPPFKRACMQWG